jgi:D-serine deaminase-like pyridoxal phosphate-dependent protein
MDPSLTIEPLIAPPLPGDLDTPALVIDLDVVERNAARLATEMAERGIALRPHAKTHKSIELGRIQLAHGAVGLTVGNLGEAEVFAGAGFTDLFLAYPIWAVGDKAARLRALHADDRLDLSVAFDSVEGAERLGAAVAGLGRRLPVLLELDPGNRRTGARPEDAGVIASAAERAGLEVRGLFTHGGHGYRSREATVTAGEDELRALTTGRDALRAVGIDPAVISAGSTPTRHSAARSPVTEMRPGTYLLGDRQQRALGAQPSDGLAAVIAATVVSAAVDGQVVVDAGAKALTKDVAPYLDGHGAIPAYPDAVIERVSDYHGVVRIPGGTPVPKVGEVLAIVPNHICPVVDLRDWFVATRAGSVVGRWPVDARGRSG